MANFMYTCVTSITLSSSFHEAAPKQLALRFKIADLAPIMPCACVWVCVCDLDLGSSMQYAFKAVEARS